MYRKLRSLGIIDKNEYDGFNLDSDQEMDSPFNQLITDNYFEKKQDYETIEEYNFRLAFHLTIVSKTKIRGDMAKTIAYMEINRIKLGVTYGDDYEKILDRMEKLYDS